MRSLAENINAGETECGREVRINVIHVALRRHPIAGLGH